MKTLILASAFALALTGTAFAVEIEAPVDGATVMTEQEMDQASGGVGLDFIGPADYTRIINLGSYSLVYDGTKWFRVKN